jgi:tRNA 5-methylaminomethyl-2-thiouridine biosynthesis bifunctional protein
MVIGAGLAGSAVCVALARRGWKLTLVDAALGPAQGASALPVGMLSPHVTRAPTPLSRLCALGVADARAELQRLVLQGQGWQVCEVDNLGHDPGRWPAALVRPAALVNAWLAETRGLGALECLWGRRVTGLTRTPDSAWVALDDNSQPIAQAPTVVVASAHGVRTLLEGHHGLTATALPLRPVKGQMSLAALDDAPLAPRPMRNNGVFVPAYEDAGLPPTWPTRIWAMGSTYERGADNSTVDATAHERNAQSLQEMHAPAAGVLRQSAVDGSLQGWAQVRCASLDRLPMVGAAPDVPELEAQMNTAGARRGRVPMADTPRLPDLYLLTALGSRGLTLAHWCANLLAARMSGEASPLPPTDLDLERALDPSRFAWKAARRQPA